MATENISLEEFLFTVPKSHQEFVAQLNDKLTAMGCSLVIKEAKSGFALSYLFEKKTVMNWVFRKTGVWARIYGDHASSYENLISSLPAEMLEKMTTSRDCKRLLDPNACSATCTKGFIFSLNGETLKKCRNDGMMFLLTNETKAHISNLVCAEVAARKTI